MYRAGVTHPSEPFPWASRAAFILEKKPAITGVAADVPDAMNLDPPTSQANCTAKVKRIMFVMLRLIIVI